MKLLCTVLARGGSKGVTGKNLRLLGGKPLLAHTLEQARTCGLFDCIAVSSDSPAILEAGMVHGADIAIRRPDEMASDTASKLPAILHCLLEVERLRETRFDGIVDMDCTSPLRLPEDIRGAVALWRRTGVGNVITGAPARRSPYFNLVERGPDGVVRLSKPPAKAIVRRQDAPECFDMNASIYVWSRDAFVASPGIFHADTLLYAMPEERSVDIDSPLDFKLVELLMAERENS